jgi:hypothetical protein
VDFPYCKLPLYLLSHLQNIIPVFTLNKEFDCRT